MRLSHNPEEKREREERREKREERREKREERRERESGSGDIRFAWRGKRAARVEKMGKGTSIKNSMRSLKRLIAKVSLEI